MDAVATLKGLHSPAEYQDLAHDPETGDEVLRALADSPYSFVWTALAANPNTPRDVLARLCGQRSGIWNDNQLLLLIALHPHADRAVLLEVLDQLRAKLAKRESRPYAAVLAMADRVEIDPAEIWDLGRTPGASARMRRGLRRRIADRSARGS
ncbi:hypothetical protein [Hamadaea sp.]|uniref:hypothetical protein n=1 Tax=Hamadaea sp. TaxID=2024425 RepID=UPI0025BF16FD|nr:hypothetical protein [Hamadaea sp.]